MERRPEPRDYANSRSRGWTPEAVRLAVALLVLSVSGLGLIFLVRMYAG